MKIHADHLWRRPRRAGRRLFAALAVAACAWGLGGSQAVAAGYPDRIVTVIVPFAPGGGADVVGRIVAQKLQERLGRPFVVENRAGAGGNLGAELVARAQPDGYTLLAGATVAHAINVNLMKSSIRFDLIKDFEPIAMTGVVPLTLVVNPKVPVKTVKEFIDYAKSKPGEIAYASAGQGSTQHLAGEMFKMLTNTDLRHVPYRGSAPAMNDVVAGHVQANLDTGPVVVPQVRGGLLTPLAVTSAKRLPELPNVPTMAEAGVPGFEVATEYGYLAPAGTPKEIVDRLNKEINEILKMPDVKEKFAAQGVFEMITTPDEMKQHLRDEIAKWGKVIEEAKVETQ